METKRLAGVCALAVVAATCMAGGVDVGDRRPAAHRQIPARAFWHEGKGGNWVDVTKPPFCAKGDG